MFCSYIDLLVKILEVQQEITISFMFGLQTYVCPSKFCYQNRSRNNRFLQMSGKYAPQSCREYTIKYWFRSNGFLLALEMALFDNVILSKLKRCILLL